MSMLSDFAVAIRNADWTACMSDSFGAFGAHEANLKKLAEKVPAEGMPKSYKRLLELGTQYESQITWLSWFESHPTEIGVHTGISVEARLEHAWRWVGAYLWAHGVTVTKEEAQALVYGPEDKSKYGPLCGGIKWDVADKKIASQKV